MDCYGKLRVERERNEKLRSFERKLAEGENLLKMGIITEQELSNLKEEYEKMSTASNPYGDVFASKRIPDILTK